MSQSSPSDTSTDIREQLERVPVGNFKDGSPMYLEDISPVEAVAYFDAIEALLTEATTRALERVKQRLPNPDNNVEEWRGHNLGLSQAVAVVDEEIERLHNQSNREAKQ